MISRWVSQKDAISSVPSKRKVRITSDSPLGRKTTLGDLEVQLMEWIRSQRRRGRPVSIEDVKKQSNRLSASQPSLKWIRGILSRNNFVYRRTTHVSQSSKVDPEVILEFKKFVDRQLTRFSECNVGNMDETSLELVPNINMTLNQKGSSTVTVVQPKSRLRITILLAISYSGNFLTPVIISKRKKDDGKRYSGVLVYFQEKGWNNSELSKRWIEDIWIPEIAKSKFFGVKTPSLLVWDSFAGHMVEEVSTYCKKENVKQCVVPSGYTWLLQPLDVAINKKLKAEMRARFSSWMETHTETTVGGNLKSPSIELFCQWLSESLKLFPRKRSKIPSLASCHH